MREVIPFHDVGYHDGGSLTTHPEAFGGHFHYAAEDLGQIDLIASINLLYICTHNVLITLFCILENTSIMLHNYQIARVKRLPKSTNASVNK